MALLAYDPQRVSRLRRELVDAADDLRRVDCADPVAADAIRVVRAAMAQLDATWLPLVSRLLASDPLSGSQRRAAQINSLDQSLIRVMADGYGWSVQADPLPELAAVVNASVVNAAVVSAVVTEEEARALGAALNGIDPEALANDPEQLAWLAQQLAIIGRDHALSAQFLANLHHWDVLPFVLAQQRAQSFGSEYVGSTFAADLDPVFDGLMSIWRTTLPVATLHTGTAASIADLLPPMDAPDPYVQALMLRSLRLDPIALATVANDLLRNWLDNKEAFDGGALDLAVPFGPNTADVLLQDIAGNATASAYFLALVSDRPALLFHTLDDPEIGYQLALAGTDPTHTSSPAAGSAVLAILDYFQTDPYATAPSTDGYPGDYGPFLGQLIAPWLLQFTGASDEWAATDVTKARLLAVALNDDQGLQALVAASQRMADGFAHSLITARNDRETLALSLQIGGLLSLLGQSVVNEHIDDESERSHFLWDLTWTVLTTTTNFVPGGAVANIAAGLGATALEGLLATYFVGSNADGVRQDGEYSMDVVVTVAAAVMLMGLFQSWQTDGRLALAAAPPPAPRSGEGCPSSEYRDDVERWAGQLPGGASGSLGLTALNLVGNFIGRAQADEHCAELAG